jgi:hypothetical protein
MTKIVWLDLPGVSEDIRPAVLEEGIHQRVNAVVSDQVEVRSTLPASGPSSTSRAAAACSSA